VWRRPRGRSSAAGGRGGRVRAHARKARIHQAAGDVFFIREQAVHFAARRIVEQGQELRARLEVHALQNVGEVVRGQQAHPNLLFTLRDVHDDLALVVMRQAKEKFAGEFALEFAEFLDALVFGQRRPSFAQLGDFIAIVLARCDHRDAYGFRARRGVDYGHQLSRNSGKESG